MKKNEKTLFYSRNIIDIIIDFIVSILKGV
jgi:hypothetical protein